MGDQWQEINNKTRAIYILCVGKVSQFEREKLRGKNKEKTCVYMWRRVCHRNSESVGIWSFFWGDVCRAFLWRDEFFFLRVRRKTAVPGREREREREREGGREGERERGRGRDNNILTLSRNTVWYKVCIRKYLDAAKWSQLLCVE